MRMLGEWRIIEMEVWDKDLLDLMGPARIAISASGQGEFAFGCVNGAFSALGVEGSLIGEICLDDGDESEFRAVSWDSSTAC